LERIRNCWNRVRNRRKLVGYGLKGLEKARKLLETPGKRKGNGRAMVRNVRERIINCKARIRKKHCLHARKHV